MLHFEISNDRQQLQFDRSGEAIEFGRAPSEDGQRFVIEDRYVSRRQLRVEPIDSQRVRLENFGQACSLDNGSTLEAHQTQVVELPLQLIVGYTTIAVTSRMSKSEGDPSLQTIAPPVQAFRSDGSPADLVALGDSPSSETLARWFETLLSVQRAAAGSEAFYEETARAMVDLVGLDCGMVILREADGWKEMAFHSVAAAEETSFSRSILSQVTKDKRTLFRSPKLSEGVESLVRVESVVASPIFDANDQILGVVYGSRGHGTVSGRTGIQPLEAQVVQLLAGAVSAGLARMEQETIAARNRARFEQFSSPELAAELERNPNLLDGTDRDITVLFADIRSFSRFSQILGARDMYRLVGDVMDTLTDKVLEYQGVIIDYYGDGLVAMWNAPTDQPDHADLACRAALAMQGTAAGLNDRWQDRLGMPVAFGIGINTGTAEVGNAGSSRRLKYGPRGHAVNVASRVEGATKQLGVSILITGATHSRLASEFVTRRLCHVQVVGIAESIELIELYGVSADQQWLEHRAKYEQALSFYESRQFEKACRLLDEMLRDDGVPDDEPTSFLSQRAAEHRDSTEESSTIVELKNK